MVGDLVTGVRPEQWSVPTPCTDWNVHQPVDHLVAVNLTIASLLSGQALPERGLGHLGDDPAGAYRASGATLQAAFDQPGIFERSFRGILGTATGEEFLQIRLYDLLAHGWDLAQATGQPAVLPEDLAEQALTFRPSSALDTTAHGPIRPCPAHRRGRTGHRPAGCLPRPLRHHGRHGHDSPGVTLADSRQSRRLPRRPVRR